MSDTRPTKKQKLNNGKTKEVVCETIKRPTEWKDRKELFAVAEEKGISYREIMRHCIGCDGILNFFKTEMDDLLALLYFLCFPPANFVAAANDAAREIWQKLNDAEKPLLLFVLCCEKGLYKQTGVLAETMQQAFRQSFGAYVEPTTIMKIYDEKIWDLLLYVALRTQNIAFVTWLRSRETGLTVGKMLLEVNKCSEKKPMAIYIFNKHDVNDALFAMLLNQIDPDILWEIAVKNYKNNYLFMDTGRLQQLTTVKNKGMWFAEQCSALLDKMFRTVSIENIVFFKKISLLSVFLCCRKHAVLKEIWQKQQKNTWEIVKAELGVDVLHAEMQKDKEFATFRMDFPFYKGFMEKTQSVQKMRNKIGNEEFFISCMEEDNVEAATWGWNLLTPVGKSETWRTSARLLSTFIEKNTQSAMSIFKMMYGDGKKYDSKNEELSVTSNIWNIIPNSNSPQNESRANALFWKEIIKCDMLMYVFCDAVQSRVTRFTPPLFYISIFKDFINKIAQWKYISGRASECIIPIFNILTRYPHGNLQKTHVQAAVECFRKIQQHESASKLIFTDSGVKIWMKNALSNSLLEVFLVLADTHENVAVRENYFRTTENMRDIVSDSESAVRDLNEHEKKALAAVHAKYDQTLRTIGEDNMLEIIRTQLREEFESYATFPFTVKRYNNGDNTRYFKNVHHTAWRLLATPNPLVNVHSLFITEDDSSQYKRYKDLIGLYYLAASDETEPCIANFASANDRLEYFYAELASLNRTHNMDGTRTNARGKSEAYDDMRNDNPSCYSGFKKRLVNSVPGSAVSSVFQEEATLAEMFNTELTAAFKRKLGTCREKAMQSYERIAVDMEELTEQDYKQLCALNLDENEQNEMFLRMFQFSKNAREIVGIRKRLKTTSDMRKENVHAFTFSNIFRECL